MMKLKKYIPLYLKQNKQIKYKIVALIQTLQCKMDAIAEKLHEPARRYFLCRKVDIRTLNKTFEGDLIDMSKYVNENKGFKFLLTVIDTFSKYAYAVPQK